MLSVKSTKSQSIDSPVLDNDDFEYYETLRIGSYGSVHRCTMNNEMEGDDWSYAVEIINKKK
jgi:hypothetical protein